MTEEKNIDNAVPQADLHKKADNTDTTPNTPDGQILIPVKFNKEIKELTVDEATQLAQKGMKYDLICDDYKALKDLSAQKGKSVAQFVEELKSESLSIRKKELAQKCGGNEEIAEHILKLENEEIMGDKGFAELKEHFPQFKTEEDLPPQVIESANLKGTLLLDEYLRYRLAEKKRTAEALQRQKYSENASVGSQLNRKGQDSPETTEFLKGLWK